MRPPPSPPSDPATPPEAATGQNKVVGVTGGTVETQVAVQGEQRRLANAAVRSRAKNNRHAPYGMPAESEALRLWV